MITIKTWSKEYDVIVVGSGGAGLRAAIGARLTGARVLIVSRGRLNRSGATLLAGANISADIACDGGSLHELGISSHNKNDTKQNFRDDIFHEGFYLSREDLVDLFVDTAPDRIQELMEHGMVIRDIEGKRGISVFGSDILDSLMRWLNELGVSKLENHIFTDLVLTNGSVSGVVLVDTVEGELVCVPSRAVVLATGGSHNLFPHNSGSTDLCGEGPAAALRAGSELVDMEMVTFCPTIISYPERFRGNLLPYVFIGRGYATLINRLGHTFTHRYLTPQVDQLALETEWDKMLLSYVIQKEVSAGNGTMHGGVYCMLPQYPTNIMEELYRQLPSLKTGIYRDLMELPRRGEAFVVSPAAHYFPGGIRINSQASSYLPGLFAAGECAGGVFGANRVSAATTEMLIEGAQAGRSAGEYACGCGSASIDREALNELERELTRPFERTHGESPASLLHSMWKITDCALGVIRTEGELTVGLAALTQLRQTLPDVKFTDRSRLYNREWMEYLQLRNGLLTASAMAKAALLRRESRGVHIRADYLCTDNEHFLGNIIIENDRLEARIEPVFNRACPDHDVQGYSDYIEQVVARLS